MNVTRQDAWTKDEDILLAETVLRYIQNGKTQLEAFKEVAERLSRTSAACGFRWNATIRKQYQEAIQKAKEERKHNGRGDVLTFANTNPQEKHTIESAILLLEKMKARFPEGDQLIVKEQDKIVKQLEAENERLKQQISRYHDVWEKIGKLWQQVNERQPAKE